MSILKHLARNPASTATAVAASLNRSPSSVAASLSRMYHDGLVSRHGTPYRYWDESAELRTHGQFRRILLLYVDGGFTQVSLDQQLAFLEHAHGCEACRAAIRLRRGGRT